LRERTAAFARPLLLGVVALTAMVTAATFAVQPQAPASLSARPWSVVFPLLSVGGIALIWMKLRREGGELAAFLGSCLFIGGLLTSAANSVYPYVLPARPDAALSLTISNASTSHYGQAVALWWWLPALALTTAYFVFLFRRFGGRGTAGE